ncbi:hypothetical protein V2J09_019520 [Rumex salicifolius]
MMKAAQTQLYSVKQRTALQISPMPSAITEGTRSANSMLRPLLSSSPPSNKGFVSNAAGSMSSQSLMIPRGVAGGGWLGITNVGEETHQRETMGKAQTEKRCCKYQLDSFTCKRDSLITAHL